MDWNRKMKHGLLAILRLIAASSAMMVLCVALAQDGTYRLQPEDVLRIRVREEEDLTAVVQVGRDGNITVPFLGLIRAQGKTTTELEAEIRDLYIQTLGLRDPLVSVTIEQFRQVRATISGFIPRPGIYEFRPGDTILTLFTQGGGQLGDGRSDLRRATLRRKDSPEAIPINIYALVTYGDMSQDYEIQDGDQLVIPEQTRNAVLVLGKVAQPGPILYTEDMTLMDAITLARGEIPYQSKFSDILVIRQIAGSPGNYLRIRCNFVEFLRRGDGSQNISLQPGDLVYVPDAGNINFNQVQAIANLVFILDRFGLRITPF